MTAFMVDSCVWLDIFTEDSIWTNWSSRKLADAADEGMLVINPIIYAEISIRFKSIEETEAMLPGDFVEFRPIPLDAAFLAGKCFLKYRRRGGSRKSPLPDFFIGAHAAVENLPLITRDPTRFRAYFPRLKLIHPD